MLATPSVAAPTTPVVTVATTGSPYDEMSADDLRVAMFRILADPDTSAALRAAAGAALDDNTPEALRHFLEVGQYEVGQ
ncbi:hypothetical protein ACFQ9J_35950 [Streptomyces sp. NPDC056529]|uniref:hypothetical protein n=1 Tax=Streptomyces sp. NPDC056529 TaxID=3345855 RepID=UPI0036C5C12F